MFQHYKLFWDGSGKVWMPGAQLASPLQRGSCGCWGLLGVETTCRTKHHRLPLLLFFQIKGGENSTIEPPIGIQGKPGTDHTKTKVEQKDLLRKDLLRASSWGVWQWCGIQTWSYLFILPSHSCLIQMQPGPLCNLGSPKGWGTRCLGLNLTCSIEMGRGSKSLCLSVAV